MLRWDAILLYNPQRRSFGDPKSQKEAAPPAVKALAGRPSYEQMWVVVYGCMLAEILYRFIEFQVVSLLGLSKEAFIRYSFFPFLNDNHLSL